MTSGGRPRWLDELGEFLEIESVSADPARAADVRRAGDWVVEFVERAGGRAGWAGAGGPVVAGEIPSSGRGRAPTVLLYGHFDVQPPDPLELWESPPFVPSVRDGVLYARGVVDNKGQLFAMLKAAEELAREGVLPVRVRVVCDGEEETGGTSIVDFLRADAEGADACLVYDNALVGHGLPAFNVATRGLVYMQVAIRTGGTDLHSGLYGGAALNALHGLQQMLDAVLPRAGRLPEPLREGIVAPSAAELRDWARLPPGDTELATAEARPADVSAADEFHLRTLGEPSLDLNGVIGGSPDLVKTVIPAEARANLSIRLVPRQDPTTVASSLERLLRDAAPVGAEVETRLLASVPPALVDAESIPVRTALDAFEGVVGTRPLLVRWGATLPVMGALAERAIPAVLTGLAPADCNMHAPNEHMPLASLETAIETAKATLIAWGDALACATVLA